MNAALHINSGRERRRSSGFDEAVEAGKRIYFDPKFGIKAVRVLPGEHYITQSPDIMLVTVLGSCVAACIRDPLTGIGGMNHFMLPESETGAWGKSSAAMRYGNHAMEALINDIIKTGCPKERLEIKVFGGANVTSGDNRIGDSNGAFVKRHLNFEGLKCKAADLGGSFPRRIHFFPGDGRVKRLLLRRASDVDALVAETNYRKRLKTDPLQGEIELFAPENKK